MPLSTLAPRLLGVLVALAASGGSLAFDAAGYHAAQCTRCHDTGVYTRENRFVQNFPALQAQVERCDINLAAKLPPEQLAGLIDYLNDNFYKFDK